MVTQALGAALSGLQVAQKGLEVVSTNISNANTEGYTAKRISQETLVSNGVGVGVRTSEVTRYVDQAIQRDYRNQTSVQNYYTTRASYLERVTASHGSTDAETNIASNLARLQQGFVELSAAPDSRIVQNTVLGAARTVASGLNKLSANLSDLRNQAQSALSTEVKNLNDTLKQIADLNNAIAPMQAVGKSTAALQDQRDILVKKVAEQLDVSSFIDGGGVLVLQTKQGQVLADQTARPIQFKNELVTSALSYPDSLGGLLLTNADGSTQDLAVKAPGQSLGGKIGALFDLRDKDLPAYGAQLDALAYTMAVRFDDQGLRLFTDATGTIPANDPTVYTGFAARIQVNDAVQNNPTFLQSGTAGPYPSSASNELVMKIVNYTFGRTKDAAGTPNAAYDLSAVGPDRGINIAITADTHAALGDFASAMIDAQAGDYTMAKNSAATETQYTQDMQKRLLDGSAVDTDQEMAKMIELQKSYAASAKMIGTLDELFQELLNAFR